MQRAIYQARHLFAFFKSILLIFFSLLPIITYNYIFDYTHYTNYTHYTINIVSYQKSYVKTCMLYYYLPSFLALKQLIVQKNAFDMQIRFFVITAYYFNCFIVKLSRLYLSPFRDRNRRFPKTCNTRYTS